MRSPSSPRYARLTSLLFTLAGVASVVAGVHCGDDGNAGTGPGTTGSGGNGTSGSGGSGGSGTNAGSGGTAGSSVGGGASGGSAGMPNEGPLPTIAKVDVVLVVDNSASMADKQAILATAIRDLVGRLTAPDCVRVDENGNIVERAKSTAGTCAAGQTPELTPIADIHIGVISSSLGGHGSDQCDPTKRGPQANDRGHLITRSIAGGAVPTWDGTSGFLVWDPTGAAKPPGETNADKLVANASSLVTGAGQTGCGFESSLEAAYRFLSDPNPPKSVSVLDPTAVSLSPAEVSGLDDELLQQRAEFLRPDSFVIAMVLSDENDCSIIDGVAPLEVRRNGQAAAGWTLERNDGFVVNYLTVTGAAGGKEFRMKSGTSACATDPDSPDCKNCFVGGGPGCRDLAREEDNLSLRCWDQKRRFGVDTLYPVQRYVDGFQEREVFDLRTPDAKSGAALVPNPLFADLPYERYQQLKAQLAAGEIPEETFKEQTRRLGADIATRAKRPPRDRRSIAFAALVGVPWQDLANDPNDLGAGYKRSEDLAWANLRTTDGAPPADPFMRESIKARSGKNPITQEDIGGAENAINGHEWNSQEQDLMYACRAPLPQPRDCSDTETSCDCAYLSSSSSASEIQAAADLAKNPLCQEGPGKPYGQTQYYAKAYPGGRFVEVAHRLAGRSVLASVCTPNTDNPSAADFGYRPAVSAVIEKIRPQATGQ